MKVSVLMPVFNRETVVSDAIRSVLDQSYSDFEFIICDDGSTDNTVSVVESFEDSRISMIKNTKNMGIEFSRNKLFSVSRGEYICWIDSDDIISKNKIMSQSNILDNDPNVDILFSKYTFFRHGERHNSKKNISRLASPDVSSLIERGSYSGKDSLAVPSCMTRRKVFETNKFFENSEAADDVAWINSVISLYKLGVDLDSIYFFRRHNERKTYESKIKNLKISDEDVKKHPWFIANNRSIRE